MFDAVWTAALAINSVASKLPNGVTLLRNFTYNGEKSKNISRLIYEEALKVKFFGLSVSENCTIFVIYHFLFGMLLYTMFLPCGNSIE